MTRKELDLIWRQLAFWKRLIVECVFCILIMLLVEVSFSGRSGDFAKALFEGAVFGFLYAVIDHACFAGNRTGDAGGDTK
jgi:hypothetical protein